MLDPRTGTRVPCKLITARSLTAQEPSTPGQVTPNKNWARPFHTRTSKGRLLVLHHRTTGTPATPPPTKIACLVNWLCKQCRGFCTSLLALPLPNQSTRSVYRLHWPDLINLTSKLSWTQRCFDCANRSSFNGFKLNLLIDWVGAKLYY